MLTAPFGVAQELSGVVLPGILKMIPRSATEAVAVAVQLLEVLVTVTV